MTENEKIKALKAKLEQVYAVCLYCQHSDLTEMGIWCNKRESAGNHETSDTCEHFKPSK